MNVLILAAGYATRLYPMTLNRAKPLRVVGGKPIIESLADCVERARKTDATVAVYDVRDFEAIKTYGNITVDAERIITRFEEKPKKPQGTLAAIALYYYSPAVLSLLTTYLAAGNNPDQPGRFVQWLYTHKPVKTFEIKGKWLDIGSKETLENADAILASLKTAS